MLVVDKDMCCGDELCTTVCPAGAAQMSPDDNKAEIDVDMCIECYACMNICPNGAIQEE